MTRLPKRSLLGAFVTAAVLSACSPQTPPGTAPSPATTDTLWYVSARAREEGRDTRRLADSLEYGIVISRVRSNGDPLRGRLRVTPVDSVRLTAAEFASTLRARSEAASASDSLAVLLVHGFGTSLHEAWESAAQARLRSTSQAPWVIFCWPSNGSGVAWPRAGRIVTRAYREDSTSATTSRVAFSQVLQTLLPAIGGRHLIVAAHSMGSQLVGETLAADSGLRSLLTTDPLRALAFFAPDVEAEHFNDFVLPAVVPLARRVVVYASSDDRMLTLSRMVNKSERAGLLRGGPRPHADVETVDATDGHTAENRMQRAVGTHHPIRNANAALFDLLQVVAGAYPATCRATLGTAALSPGGVWKLTAVPPPPVKALAACQGIPNPGEQADILARLWPLLAPPRGD